MGLSNDMGSKSSLLLIAIAYSACHVAAVRQHQHNSEAYHRCIWYQIMVNTCISGHIHILIVGGSICIPFWFLMIYLLSSLLFVVSVHENWKCTDNRDKIMLLDKFLTFLIQIPFKYKNGYFLYLGIHNKWNLIFCVTTVGRRWYIVLWDRTPTSLQLQLQSPLSAGTLVSPLFVYWQPFSKLQSLGHKHRVGLLTNHILFHYIHSASVVSAWLIMLVLEVLKWWLSWQEAKMRRSAAWLSLRILLVGGGLWRGWSRKRFWVYITHNTSNQRRIYPGLRPGLKD